MTAWEHLLAASFLERLGWTLLHSLWQLAALSVLAALLLRAARRGSPQVRYAIACATLLGMLVFPVATYCVLDGAGHEAATVATSGLPSDSPRGATVDRGAYGPAPSDTFAPRSAEPTPAKAANPAATYDWPRAVSSIVRPALPWLAFFWIAGFVLLFAYHLGGWVVLGQLKRRATPLATARPDELVTRWSPALGVRCPVALLESAAIRVPTVMGWLRPVILLPVGLLAGLSTAEVEAILVHELVHVRRYDYLVNLLQTVAESLLFYHPAAWWISYRIRLEREYCVDRTAAAASGDRLAYAKALAALEEQCGKLHHLAVAATGGRLRHRIQYLLCGPTGGTSRHATLLAGTLVSLAVVAVMVLLPPAQGRLAAAGLADEQPAPTASPDGEAQAPDGEATTVLHVATDGSQPYTSIQKAIDAAPDGAVIKIGPGTYDEQLTIDKPVTLVGAGWEKTLIRSTNKGQEWYSSQRRAAIQQQYLAAASDDDRQKIVNEYMKTLLRCKVVVVRDAQGVELRGLRFSLPGSGPKGGTISLPAIEVRGAKARLVDSAVVGSFGDGIHVRDGSDVEIRHCLVAAVHGTGIVVRGDAPLRARILDSDVRHCIYAGITIRGQTATAEVARCRISGASWHGIRYDDTSPRVHDNLIFDNARCGIYASGKTAAMVTGNVFYRNGVSCWSNNQDTIEGDTFARCPGVALGILGPSKPTVVRNLFFDNETAVQWSAIQGQSVVPPADLPAVRENLLWSNKTNAVRADPDVTSRISRLQQEIATLPKAPNARPIPSQVQRQLDERLERLDKTPDLDEKVAARVKALRETMASDAQTLRSEAEAEIKKLQRQLLEKVELVGQQGNVEADPRFVDPRKRDFALAADSPARKAHIGAADPISFATPWPPQPGEEKYAPPPVPPQQASVAASGLGGTGTAGRVDASTLAKDIRQRKDPALRRRGLEELQTMLSSKASMEKNRAGLGALRQVLSVKFDHGALRPLVLPLLGSEDPQVRESALRCLPSLDATADDLALVVPMVDDRSPEVRTAAGAALISIGQGKHPQQVIPALIKVLQDSNAKVVTGIIRSMWGQYTSPEFDELLIKLSHDEQYRGVTIYHCLSTMRRKSVPVCRRLIEELNDPDWNNSGRAAWGLTYGVVDEARPIVEEGLLKALPEETNDYTRGNEFKALRNVASEKSRSYLQSVLDNEMETDQDKALARDILRRLDRKR